MMDGDSKSTAPYQWMSPNAQSAITLRCTLDSNALRGMVLSLFSRIASLPWTSESVVAGDLNSIGSSYVFMQQIFSDITQSRRPVVDVLPSWLQVITNLLSPQSPSFKVNTLKYVWGNEFQVSDDCAPLVTTAGVPATFVIGYPDPMSVSDYIQPMIPATPATDARQTCTSFSSILGLLQDQGKFDTRTVPWSTEPRGRRDPSAFARVRRTLGCSQDNVGCAFGLAEIETPLLRSWIPANFCVYESDTRVSRSFRYKSADSSLLMNLPFIRGYEMSDYNNNGPSVIKFIDYEEIYCWVIEWIKYALQQVVSTFIMSTRVGQIPLSSNTFRVVLRQAVLQILTDQAAVQFLAPRSTTDAFDNVFTPFLVHTGTYSSSQFAQLRLPQILVENLRMLKSRVYTRPGVKSKVSYLPVLGRYLRDDYDYDPDMLPETPDFPAPPPRERKVFAIDYTLETQINLVDGGTGAIFVNMNSEYYQTAVMALNAYFSKFEGAGGVLSTCGGDAGPGLSLLYITKHVSTFPTAQACSRPFKILEDHVARAEGEIIEPVRFSPPGGVSHDFVQAICSSISISQELQLLALRFITPSIRVASASVFQQSVSQWQIAYAEPYMVNLATAAIDAGATSSVESSIIASASCPITGYASGMASDELCSLMEKLAVKGRSVNWMQLLSA